MYIADCYNSMAWCIDILLCRFYITIIVCFYDICNSTDILYIILWLSPHPWIVPISGYMEMNEWMNEWKGNPLVKVCSGYMTAVWPPYLNKHTN
jgi:hypothetical protein